MRNINWNDVEATSDGEFKRLPAGAYVLRITDFFDCPEKEYVKCLYDVDEGEYKEIYGHADEWKHCMFFSYKDSALGMLKGRLEVIQESNNGFDAFAAWDAGRLDMFKGRRFGVAIRMKEYVNNNGELKTKPEIAQVRTVQDVHDGKVPTLPLKKLDGNDGDNNGNDDARNPHPQVRNERVTAADVADIDPFL